MFFKTLSHLLLFLLFFSACRHLVQDEFPEPEPTIVLNALAISGENLTIHVSQLGRLGISDPIPTIDDAQISVIRNNQDTLSLIYDENGYWHTEEIVLSGNTYSITVDLSGFESVYAEQFVPESPNVENLTIIPRGWHDDEDSFHPTLELTILNDANKNLFWEVVFDWHMIIENITDFVLLNEGLPLPLFSNELMEDSEHTVSLNYRDNPNYEPEIRSVSEDYYHYVRNRYLYEQGRYPFVVGTSLVAVPLFSNVENGKGVFLAFSR